MNRARADQRPRIVRVPGARAYEARIGPRALDGLSEAVAGRQAVVVTDANVERLHAERLGAVAVAPRVVLAPGEASKSFAVLEGALERFAEHGLGRDGCVVALGGGVVLDLAGLAAALYARGIAWVACPTTLLAQVDASIGGKTAVDLRAGKNLAGAFHAPDAVLSETALLATLPARELASGLGELVKTAMIAGEELFAEVEAEADALASGDPGALAAAVAPAAETKARIVGLDEREQGPREVLNLGHTYAHALERAAGYGRVPHGAAVAAGLGVALEASRRLGVLEDPALPARTAALLLRLGLPESPGALARAFELDVAAPDLVAAMHGDKKRRAGSAARLVLPAALGRIVAGVAVEERFLRALLDDALR